MRFRQFTMILAVVAVLLPTAASAAKNRKYIVVVNAANPVESVSEKELSKIFLKTTPAWADGVEITPIDLDPESKIRKAFTKDIHDRDVSAVKVYWQTQIFSGKGVPPVETSSYDDVLFMVRGIRGAIGYIDDGVDVGDGVKVIAITE